MMSRWGIPDIIISDNGPEFSSAQFQAFSRDYGFEHKTSSPRYPQSNGQAEAGVKIAKRIVGQRDPHLALLEYRATAVSSTGYSPAQLNMSRQPKTTLPTLSSKLKPHCINPRIVRCNDKKSKKSYSDGFNRHYGSRALPKLKSGDMVCIKLDDENCWGPKGVIIGTHHAPRSYLVKTSAGAILRRNRRHLLLVPKDITVNVSDPVVVSREPPQRVIGLPLRRDADIPVRPVPDDPIPDEPLPNTAPLRNVAMPTSPVTSPQREMRGEQFDQPGPRRSSRMTKPVQRLIEEM